MGSEMCIRDRVSSDARSRPLRIAKRSMYRLMSFKATAFHTIHHTYLSPTLANATSTRITVTASEASATVSGIFSRGNSTHRISAEHGGKNATRRSSRRRTLRAVQARTAGWVYFRGVTKTVVSNTALIWYRGVGCRQKLAGAPFRQSPSPTPFSRRSKTSAADLTWCRTNSMITCLLYTSPSPRDGLLSRMPSSA